MNLSIKNNYINLILERKKLLLWFIFSLGLLLRIAFIILWDRRPNFDTQNYIAQAEGILSGNPVSGFPNGYPLIIAAVIFLTGKNLLFPAMIFLNLLAQFFTGYFLYKITKLLFTESPIQSIDQSLNHPITQSSNNSITQSFNNSITQSSNHSITQSSNHSISLLILLLFAIYPTQILYTNSVLTEAITTLFITASVYGILVNSYFLSGLSLAIASMLRTLYLPALAITFLYILYTYIRKNQRQSASIRDNLRAERKLLNQSINQSSTNQPINQSLTHSITQSPYTKYLSGLALVLSFFVLLDFSGITKFPINQNYNLLIAINGRSSSINHNISNFSESDFISPLHTYINFAHNNTKEFIIQRADALWGLWGVLPFETHHLYSKLLLSVRTFLFLSWIYWLYILIRKKEIWKQNLFNLFFIYLSILITTITIIHTVYFSSFRFIVPIEPVLLILLVYTIFRFFTINQSIIHSSNNQQPATNNQQPITNNQ